MSFRLFVYYCAVCGAWAALFAFLFGLIPDVLFPNSPTLVGGLKGLCLGVAVAVVLSCLDAVWNFSLNQILVIVPRVVCAGIIGSFGGLVCGLLGTALFRLFQSGAGEEVGTLLRILGGVVQVISWTFCGLLIGLALALYELAVGVLQKQSPRGAIRKAINCALGGTVGGFLGSIVLILFKMLLFQNKFNPWSPSAIGFVVLGACIGLLIGLSQVLLKEAWLKVEAGFRPGRELIIGKSEWTIGRAEACDLGLFGDNTVERQHARIILEGTGYLVVDNNTPAGTFVNEQRISGPTPLRSGDRIRVGKHVLAFGERAKRN